MKLIKLLFKIIFLPLTLIISLFTPAVAEKPKRVKNPYDENYFTQLLIDKHGFEEGCTINRKFKPDLFMTGFTIEVDWEGKMYEGLGQALTYDYYCDDSAGPGIVILDDVNKNVDSEKFFEVFDAYNVKVWIAKVDKTNGTILEVVERA